MIKLKYPLKFVGITQDFSSNHRANDLGWNNAYGGKNANIYACGDGVVTSICDGRNNSMVDGDSGNYVTIEYADGYKTRTCHMLKGSITVKKGDKVTRDTIIGKMGNSGYCGRNKAYHVHFIVWKNSVRVNPREHVYIYEDNVVAKTNKYDLLYYNGEEEKSSAPVDNRKYIQINAKSGVWCRKGIGFKYSKYKAIPWGTKCELVEKNVGTANGYKWDKIIYNGVTVYLPNSWNKYL